ncbi:MAG: membrane dipeptidase [Planctomycetota bacterium]|nr:membrane dipeptidase [Planctomycetota bacterium]
MQLIFDGHLDLALFALAYNRDQRATVAEINAAEEGMTDAQDRTRAAVSLPALRSGRIAVCQSTLAARVAPDSRPTSRLDLDFATPEMAYASAHGQLAYYHALQQHGEIRLLRSATELEDHWQQWEHSPTDALPIGIIISMECADPILGPWQVESWWEAGLRSVMLAHFGHSRYAAGTGVTGGLTDAGQALLSDLDRLGMILDVSHLSDESLDQALERFTGPVIASHNNCRALVPGDRQLTDDQIQRLLERDGIIGTVLDAWMLVPGWIHGTSTPGTLSLTAVADHIDHICNLAGDSHHAAIGSDIGGTNHMPSDFQTAADLQQLGPILSDRGYSRQDVDNILYANWLRFFQMWLPETAVT